MKKLKKLSVVGAVSGSFLIANSFLPPYRNVWALTQDTVDELEARKRAGSLAAIITYLLDDAELANDDSYVVQQNMALNVTAQQGILANDSFSGPANFVLLETVTSGMLISLNTDGSFSY
nr:hypothetical protein [Acidiferrobacterales bacterium]